MEYGLTPEIVAALDRGATVLTGNQRAARELRRAWDERCRAEDLPRWAPANILAWSSWTTGLHHRMILDGTADTLLMNRTQEASIWRAVIAEDESLATLKSTDSLAALAAQSWATLAKYRGLGRLKGSATNSDTESFLDWAEAFEKRCRANRLLPEARLEASLRKSIQNGDLHIDTELLLTGFDRILPSQKALLDAIADSGVRIDDAPNRDLPPQRLLATATDETDELHLAANWIRDSLTTHPRIAVIVPTLTDERTRIARVFREILAPETQSIAFRGTNLFEFSAGQTLAERPAVAAALDLLAWPGQPLHLEHISTLLLSPYIAFGAELTARAEFDAYGLRCADLLRPEVSLDWLIAHIETARTHLPGTLSALRALKAAAARRLDANRPYGDWAEVIRELLAAAGWARREHETSLEFQIRERWESTLDELATLDFEGGRVPFATAVEALQSIVSSTIFAPEARNAPVQILTPEESAGQSFDAVWFLRAGELTWPTSLAGSPLIPWPLRRDLHIPGSDPTDDANFGRWLTDRVARCAVETVIFSYALQLPEDKQKPSPALANLNLVAFTPGEAEPAPEPLALEHIDDDAPIHPLPDRPVSGGATILKSQAACGFRAFAEHRLFASGIETRALGMDPRQRGIAVHLVLERFWDEVRTQSNLRAMTTEARRETLTRIINRALSESAARAATSWDEAYLDTQRQRLLTIGTDWLDLEAKRAIPFTVISQETQVNASIGPLHLTLRIDRMDEIEGGNVLIDYKTGEAKASAWLTDRPDEPQIPLYAVLNEGISLQAVAFGKVRPGKDMGLAGFEERPGILSHPARNFAGMEPQIAKWRGTLTVLAEDFANGTARVSPKHYPVTCTHCDQRLICRLDAAALLAIDEDEPEETFG